MTFCAICPPREGEQPHPPAEGMLVCWRAASRMMAALRQIPELCAELSGLGYVERDWRRVEAAPNGARAGVERHETARAAVESGTHDATVPRWRDPVAHVLPSGPLNGSKGAPRVSGSPDARVPIRIDPTDLLGRARPASLAVAVTGAHAQDQIGNLAVATELEFWARDWADQRRERAPLPLVPILCKWLLVRLDWACAHHYAIDEFAEKLRTLRSTLEAAAGHFPAPAQAMDRPCDRCGLLTLVLEADSRYIVCGNCGRALSEDEYTSHLKEVIKMDWKRYDPASDVWTAPNDDRLVWARDDATDRVVVARFDGFNWRTWGGHSEPLGAGPADDVSYWAEISYPADPGRAKVDP